MLSSDVLTTSEAASLLGVSPRRIRQLVDEGRVRGRKRGRDLEVDAADIVAYASSERKSGPKGPRP